MYAETPGKLVLSNHFTRVEAERLSNYCHRLHRSGQTRVVLDVAEVIGCDHAGLDCWRALTEGEGGLTVTIEGVRWSQFLEVLRSTPVSDLARVCDDIRRLVPPRTVTPPRRTPHRHHPREAVNG